MTRSTKGNSAAARLGAAVLLLAAVAGCTPIGVGVGAGTATGLAAVDERGAGGVTADVRIYTDIMDQWLKFDHTMPVRLGLDVYEGRALLTGAVADPQLIADAVRLAWKVDGVKEVINEIQEVPSGFADLTHDTWITAQLKSVLTLDREVLTVNYNIRTFNGTIYLIGIAQGPREMGRVLAYARDIKHVRRVANHVRVKEPA
jgi:osmotically-inducible protein OsmY